MFGRCTPETRYRRFHGPVKAIPERYLAEALSGSPFHYALVACPEPCRDAGRDGEPDADGIVALASCRQSTRAWLNSASSSRTRGSAAASAPAWSATSSPTRPTPACACWRRKLLAEQAWITSLLRPYGPCRLTSTWAGILNVTVRLGEGPVDVPLVQP